jgi:hypothetical protein
VEGKNIRDCVVLGSSRLRNISKHTEHKLLDYRPHESPQSIELPCVIDHKDGGAHPMELGSEFSHEAVEKIKGLNRNMRSACEVHGDLKVSAHRRVNGCAGEIDYENELKRDILLIPESRHISPRSFVGCQYLLLGR